MIYARKLCYATNFLFVFERSVFVVVKRLFAYCDDVDSVVGVVGACNILLYELTRTIEMFINVI